jgi:hypothetical protein
VGYSVIDGQGMPVEAGPVVDVERFTEAARTALIAAQGPSTRTWQ